MDYDYEYETLYYSTVHWYENLYKMMDWSVKYSWFIDKKVRMQINEVKLAKIENKIEQAEFEINMRL